MHITTLISAGITLLGAIVVLRWMPGRTAAAPAAQVPRPTRPPRTSQPWSRWPWSWPPRTTPSPRNSATPVTPPSALGLFRWKGEDVGTAELTGDVAVTAEAASIGRTVSAAEGADISGTVRCR